MARPSDLTEELTLKIRQLVLEGKTYKDIQETLYIPDNTWDTWIYKDYKDFRKNLQSWKAERLIKKTEKLSEEILDMSYISTREDKEVINTDILRVKQKEAEFVRETLGKADYSKKVEQEVSNPDGSLKTIIINKYGSDNKSS